MTVPGRIGSFELGGGHHAITRISWGAILSSKLTESEFIAISNAAQSWKSVLPLESDVTGIDMVATTQNNNLAWEQRPKRVIGKVYSQNENGTGWVVSTDDNRLLVASDQYDRWENDMPQVTKILSDILTAMLASFKGDVSSVFLEYENEFKRYGLEKPVDYSEVLNAESPMLPAKIFDRGGVWHVNSGWFDTDGSQRGAILINSFCEAVRDTSRQRGAYVLRIKLFLNLVFNQEQSIGSLIGELADVFEELRQMEHCALAELLNENAVEEIKLWQSKNQAE